MLVDVIVLKPFAGLSENSMTQLREHEFVELEKQGYVQKLDEKKAEKKESIIDTKKGNKK